MRGPSFIIASIAATLVLAACGAGATETQAAPRDEVVAQDEAPRPPSPSPSPRSSSPAPEGYHTVTPVLVVPDIEVALAFYERALGAATMELARAPDGTAIHGEMRLGDSIVILTSEVEERGAVAPVTLGATNGGLLFYVPNAEAAFARATSANARSVQPVADMYWGDRVGQVTDPYGHRWALATHRYDVPDDEADRRARTWVRGTAPSLEPSDAATGHQPEGWPSVTPVLIVTDAAEAAVLAGTLDAEVREQLSSEEGQVVFMALAVRDSVVVLAAEDLERDAYLRTPSALGGHAPVSLYVHVEDADRAVARALASGAVEEAPAGATPWGDRPGRVRSPSGHAVELAAGAIGLEDQPIARGVTE